jgi:hypothetical protein
VVTTASIAAEAKALANVAHDQIVTKVVSNLVENGSSNHITGSPSVEFEFHDIGRRGENRDITVYNKILKDRKSSEIASCLGESLWGEFIDDLIFKEKRLYEDMLNR